MTLYRQLNCAIAALAIGLAGCAQEKLPPPADAKTVDLKLSGMTCEGCSMAIDEAIEKVPGVHSATVYLSNSTAKVVIDPAKEPSTEALLGAVRAAGYGAELEAVAK